MDPQCFLGFELWRKETDADWTNTWSLHTGNPRRHIFSGPAVRHSRQLTLGADFIVGHPEFGGYEVRLHSSSMEAKVRV